MPRNTPRADAEEFELHVEQKLVEGMGRQVGVRAVAAICESVHQSPGSDETQSCGFCVERRDHKL